MRAFSTDNGFKLDLGEKGTAFEAGFYYLYAEYADFNEFPGHTITIWYEDDDLSEYPLRCHSSLCKLVPCNSPDLVAQQSKHGDERLPYYNTADGIVFERMGYSAIVPHDTYQKAIKDWLLSDTDVVEEYGEFIC